MKSATLYFKEGSSDKVYTAEIKAVEAGYLVNFAYGRRGAALKAGCKTKEPVDLDKAEKIYAKLIKSKTAKGYTESGDGIAFTGTENEGRTSSVQCQLLNPVDRTTAKRLCRDPNYIMQEKFDGDRQPTEKSPEGIRGINRKGLYVPLPTPIADSIDSINCNSIVLDGEGFSHLNMVFDILELNGRCLRKLSVDQRMEILLGLDIQSPLKVVKTYRTTEEKLAFFDELEARSAEGMVFKLASSAYTAGRPNSGGNQLKFKFYDEASVVVLKANDDRRSVEMGILKEGVMRSVGNVTIPANKQVPEEGSVIEVKYLYAYQEGSLYQPQYLKPRGDIEIEACVESQLKYKPDTPS